VGEMSKLLKLSLIVIFLFCGCASIQLGGVEKGVMARIIARHLGFEVQKRSPDVAAEILVLSKKALAVEVSEDTVTIVNIVVDKLSEEIINAPLLAMDVQDLIELIRVEPGVVVTEEHLKIIRNVAQGLISGIEV